MENNDTVYLKGSVYEIIQLDFKLIIQILQPKHVEFNSRHLLLIHETDRSSFFREHSL